MCASLVLLHVVKPMNKSDIDFLVTLENGRSLLDLVGLWMDLEELLHRKVDVISEGGLKEGFGEHVLKDASCTMRNVNKTVTYLYSFSFIQVFVRSNLETASPLLGSLGRLPYS